MKGERRAGDTAEEDVTEVVQASNEAQEDGKEREGHRHGRNDEVRGGRVRAEARGRCRVDDRLRVRKSACRRTSRMR